MKTKLLLARFRPRNPCSWDSKTIESVDTSKLFVFKFAYVTEDGEEFYEPTEYKYWPTGSVINIKDLKPLTI